MVKYVFDAASKYLSQKTNSFVQTDLFNYFIKNPQFCSTEQLKKDSQREIFNKIIFLGGYFLRKNFGPQMKAMLKNCVQNFQLDEIKLDDDEKITFLLGLSNLLVYDEEKIKAIDKSLKQNHERLTTKQIQQISHSMYKLQVKDYFWQDKMNERIVNQNYSLGLTDLVQHLNVTSNQYHMKQITEEKFYKEIQILHRMFEQQGRHTYQAKFQFQFAQLIFNLYPETFGNNMDIICKSDNIFDKFKTEFIRDYKVSRILIDKAVDKHTLDYYENQGILNFIRLRNFPLEYKQHQFEENIKNLLTKLNVKFEEQKRIEIYNVDFLVENKYILSLHGPNHFIETTNGQILGISPSTIMVKRHLQQLNKYEFVDLEYQIWEKFDTSQKYTKEFKKLLNLS